MPRARIAQLAGALLLALACACSAPSAVSSAAARGCPPGYAYAGLYATKPVAGVAASLTMLDQPTVDGGHVAAWVGVGGAGEGPHDTDEWLQVGLASFDQPQGRLYYELTLPHKKPKFVQLADGIEPGQVVRVAVLELPFHPNDWVVVTPQGIAGPFHLPGSHGRWGARRDRRELGEAGRLLQLVRLPLRRRPVGGRRRLAPARAHPETAGSRLDSAA